MKRSRRPHAAPRKPRPRPTPSPSIRGAWEAYDRMVLQPVDVSDLQRRETRLAFYGGASALYYALIQSLDPGPDTEPTDADMRRFQNVHDEIEAFAKTFDDEVIARRPDLAAAREVGASDAALAEFAALPPQDRLGDQPVEAKYHDQMVAIMRTLDEFVNQGAKGDARKAGIVVLMFPFGDNPGRTNFMSNGVDRKDIVVLFKEMIQRFSGQPDISGTA